MIMIMLNFWNIMIMGIKSVISISKIKKINLIRKKCILNGIREFLIGSKPHSKGDFFSRLLLDFFDKIKLINKKIKGIKNKIIVMVIIKKIIYIIYVNFLIGS